MSWGRVSNRYFQRSVGGCGALVKVGPLKDILGLGSENLQPHRPSPALPLQIQPAQTGERFCFIHEQTPRPERGGRSRSTANNPSPSHLQAFQGLHSSPASLTCFLVTQLFTGISGPLSAEVSHPGRRGIDLIVQGQLGWIKPVGDVQVAPLAHNEAAAWRVGKKSVLSKCENLKKETKLQACILAPNQNI